MTAFSLMVDPLESAPWYGPWLMHLRTALEAHGCTVRLLTCTDSADGYVVLTRPRLFDMLGGITPGMAVLLLDADAAPERPTVAMVVRGRDPAQCARLLAGLP